MAAPAKLFSYKQQVRQVFDNAISANITVIAASIFFASLMHDNAFFHLCVVWMITISFLCTIRIFVSKKYFQAPEAESSKWERIYTILTLLVGIAWSSLSLLVYYTDELLVQVLIFMLLIGAITASVPVLSSVLRSFYAYSIPMIVGLSAALILKGSSFFIVTGVMVLIYGGLIIKLAKNTHRHLCNSLEMQFRNEELIRELNNEVGEREIAQKQLKAHSKKLEKTVEERTHQLVETNKSLQTEINERQRAQEDLDQLAHYDLVTHLPNRLLLNVRLEHSLQRAKRNNALIAILFLDLDNFKHINDSLGHAAGDLLLKKVGQLFNTSTRAEDTVARLGGDEFIIIIEQPENDEMIQAFTNKLLKKLKNKIEIDDNSIYISTSIGISVYPRDGDTVEKLIASADAAMYKAKRLGKNNFQFYTPELTEKAFERVVLESNLRNALANNEFTVYFQPKVCLSTGKVIGVEALVRWIHHDLGLLTPGHFLHIAEDAGLIIPLGQFVLEASCKQMQQWRKAGLSIDHVAVNVSGIQIDDQNFISSVENILHKTNCSPNWLELEITESSIMKESEKSIETLNYLKSLGIRFAIDDFGTGYSSLSHLKRLPVDTLKIDRSFISDIHDDSDDLAIVEAIIALANTLQLTVTAEGIENIFQESLLQKLKCDVGQGFYYFKPAPPEEITPLLDTLFI